jgi:predicted transcriptional regulator
MNSSSIRAAIAAEVARQGITQTALAPLCGIPQGNLSHYLRTGRGLSVATLERLLAALDMRVTPAPKIKRR